jgi:hypothetical protein
MKNKLILLAVITTFILSGCSSSTGVDEDSTTTQTASLTTPDRKAEVSGVIKNIIGNEVTISLLLKEASASTGIELTDEEKAAKQAANKAAKESGEKTSGAGMTDAKLSGETVEVVIPVGTTVVKSSGLGDGAFISLNIGDMYKGDTVKIWTIEGGEVVILAEFVQVLTQ